MDHPDSDTAPAAAMPARGPQDGLAIAILGRVAACFLEGQSPRAVLAAIHRQLSQGIGATSFFYYGADPVRPGWLTLECWGGLDQEPPAEIRELAPGALLCGEVAHSRAPLVVQDLQKDCSIRAAFARAAGITLYAGYPLIAEGRLLGTLSYLSTSRRHWGQDSLDLLQAVADLVAARLHRGWQAAHAGETERSLHRQLEAALEAAGNIGTFAMDLLADRVVGDRHLARLYDLPEAEVKAGLPVARFIAQVHPEDRAAVAARHAAAIAGVALYANEYRITRGGQDRWVEARGTCHFDPRGQLTAVIGMVIDTTERRQRAALLERTVADRTEALRDALQKQQVLIEHHPDILWIVRVDREREGRLRFVYELFNSGTARQTGFQPQDLVGRTPHECFPQALADAVVEKYVACVARRGRMSYPETHDVPIGRRHYETTLVPIFGPSGALERIIGNARDTTDQLALESQMRQAQKMEAVGRLSAGVAHDFNNILQSVSGALELLRDEVAPGTEADGLLDVAVQSCRRGGHLTHQLLAYTRQQVLRPRVVRVAALVEQLVATLRRTIGPHIDIEIEALEPDLSVRVDTAMFETALINLAVNAADAMPQGGRLLFRLFGDSSPSGVPRVVVAVEDSGSGIPADVLPHVFEPFFSTKGLGGTGLGLPMVQGFVRQSGGDLSVQSSPSGTVAQLWLPGVVARPAATAVLAAPEAVAVVRGRALLVDDDCDVVITTAAFLRRVGMEVVCVKDGEAALAVLTRDPGFDLVITDFAMPGLNGLDLLTRVRARRPLLPFVVITGHAQSIEALDAQKVTVLCKPFRREKLVAVVRAVLANAAAEPALI